MHVWHRRGEFTERAFLSGKMDLSQAEGINALISGATKTEPFWEEKVTMPIAHFIPWLGRKIQWLQQGDFRVYCVYFVIALVAILLSIALM